MNLQGAEHTRSAKSARHPHSFISFRCLIVKTSIAARVNGSSRHVRTAQAQSSTEVIKRVPCLTQLSMKFVLLINLKFLIIANSFLLNIAEYENFSANK